MVRQYRRIATEVVSDGTAFAPVYRVVTFVVSPSRSWLPVPRNVPEVDPILARHRR
jgi:hypothetical protein